MRGGEDEKAVRLLIEGTESAEIGRRPADGPSGPAKPHAA
jgi:hypothetical protein